MKNYLSNVLDRLLREKEQADTTTEAIVTLAELLSEVYDDVLENMRELHRERLFNGYKTINGVAFKRWKNSCNDKV